MTSCEDSLADSVVTMPESVFMTGVRDDVLLQVDFSNSNSNMGRRTVPEARSGSSFKECQLLGMASIIRTR